MGLRKTDSESKLDQGEGYLIKGKKRRLYKAFFFFGSRPPLVLNWP